MSGPDETGVPDPGDENGIPEETFPVDRTFDSALLGDDLWHTHADFAEESGLEDDDLVFEDIKTQVRDTILTAAREAGVKAVFAEGRRNSDITLVLLKGPRLEVLAFAPILVEDFALDLEVMRSAEMGGSYELMMAVTDNLEEQSVQHPERRQKLQRFLSELEN